MLNIKRWKELKAMTKAELEKLAEQLNKDGYFCTSNPVSILAAENRRDYPEIARNLDEWIK